MEFNSGFKGLINKQPGKNEESIFIVEFFKLTALSKALVVY